MQTFIGIRKAPNLHVVLDFRQEMVRINQLNTTNLSEETTLDID